MQRHARPVHFEIKNKSINLLLTYLSFFLLPFAILFPSYLHLIQNFRGVFSKPTLHTFCHPVVTCCDILRVVGSSLKMGKFFGQHFRCCMMLYSFGHARATLLRLSMRTSLISYFKAQHALSSMSQHIATGWPNVCNMLCPTMMWYVVLKCCMRLASPFTTWSNNVVICCAEMLWAFGRGLRLQSGRWMFVSLLQIVVMHDEDRLSLSNRKLRDLKVAPRVIISPVGQR